MAASADGSGGRLACVGLGMMLGAHIGPRARSHVEQANVVFAAVSDPLVEQWLQGMNDDVRSLQVYYAEGKPRRETYRQMVEAMLEPVRAGRFVCGAFYGHPGVFARAPHEAIAQARAEGFIAYMEPGVSAEACLYADLGIDPGRFGCQHHEASQLLLYRRRLDPSAHLVVWQAGWVGDRQCLRFSTGPAQRALLVERLREDYPADHEIIVYEAATLPVGSPRIERLRLDRLEAAVLNPHSTLVLPPAIALQPDLSMQARIDALARSEAIPAAV
ncbi:hypothetical protein H4F99_09730 [Lysobacter sp. SG-8]|uniref:Tetrapyrrole methylase domain-containing protein n=1 Tax=Marilutibacter penaei TaxID=2759900 RepID=A0A7W3YEG6_9GAMM|nr:SAM-dependent methyltransferase [Lysobacter penaei]MBB1088769.1 hypothetical protein [Lysobacter penaei]